MDLCFIICLNTLNKPSKQNCECKVLQIPCMCLKRKHPGEVGAGAVGLARLGEVDAARRRVVLAAHHSFPQVFP